MKTPITPPCSPTDPLFIVTIIILLFIIIFLLITLVKYYKKLHLTMEMIERLRRQVLNYHILLKKDRN